MQLHIRRAVAVLALIAGLFATSITQPIAAQEGSGRIIREFLTALDAGDMDAAMALVSPVPELETSDSLYLTGVEDVRAYLEALPRPIVILSTLPWGGQRHEAHILAGDLPLLIYVQGASGLISYIYIAPDTPPPAEEPASEPVPAPDTDPPAPDSDEDSGE